MHLKINKEYYAAVELMPFSDSFQLGPVPYSISWFMTDMSVFASALSMELAAGAPTAPLPTNWSPFSLTGIAGRIIRKEPRPPKELRG